jgi:hypothetical protein
MRQAYFPSGPSLTRIERPHCSRCTSRMMLAVISDAIKGLGAIDAHIRRRIRAIIVRQRLAGTLAQAAHTCRFLQSIARRRLGAVRAVQSKPSLKLRQTRFQRRDLSRLRGDQRYQLFPARLPRRGANHPAIDSKTDSAVQKNPARLKVSPKSGNLGSYVVFNILGECQFGPRKHADRYGGLIF